MSDPEALFEAHRQVERRQQEEWPYRVKVAIEGESLAVAGFELMKLVDFTLKTQHGSQFNLEVRGCVHAFWNRCEREKKDQQARLIERLTALEAHMQREAEKESLAERAKAFVAEVKLGRIRWGK